MYSHSNPEVCIVYGTRPESTKLAPLVDEFQKQGIYPLLLHTGQHYSPNLSSQIEAELGLPQPDIRLDTARLNTVAEKKQAVREVLEETKPRLTLVHGDTRSAQIGCLAARRVGIRVGHVEAGLRSYDRSMPEEVIRYVVDYSSSLLFAPTNHAVLTLIDEGIEPGLIHMTGNTFVDSLHTYLPKAIPPNLRNYFFVTVHREEVVDDPAKLSGIVNGLAMASDAHGKQVVWPLHPRTKGRLAEIGLYDTLAANPSFILKEPVSYFESLGLQRDADLILTDSGGIQEEACVLNVPCVTLRTNTERPETIEVGANILAGHKPATILAHTSTMLAKPREWDQPYGLGGASRQIVKICLDSL